MIAEGDFVVLHCRYQWSHEDGSEGIEIFRLDAFGNILEHWGVIERIPERSADSNAMPRAQGERSNEVTGQAIRRAGCRCASR